MVNANRTGVASIALVFLLGCAQDQGLSDKGETASPAVPAGPAERVRLDPPAGWERRAVGAWTLHTPADEHAHLATSTLAAGDVVAARVAEAIAAMGGSAPRTADEQEIAVGPDKLPARAASGGCRFGAADGWMQYAVVDTGEAERLLLVYASAMDAPEEAQRTAFASVASLRRASTAR